MKIFNSSIWTILLSAMVAGAASARGVSSGGGVGGGTAGGGSVAAPMGAARGGFGSSGTPGFSFGSMNRPFMSAGEREHRGEFGENRKDNLHFRRDRFGLGFGYGYGYPYGYDYSYGADQQMLEEATRKDDYDERIHNQDSQRIALPASAFVKRYNWPGANLPGGTAHQSLAAGKPAHTPM
jgi:hypothetical protein